ncbi:MAG: hypothetical protein A2Z18_11055 [Armatimonadetes bacterium RBG_16_58_9]|nr:MAG: hypothetical protein A2Z18_11055 [Armatimonadetes bacterium RBG_16_58_9]
MKVELILAEFGRPLPDIGNLQAAFPGAAVRVITDGDVPVLFSGPRAGHRMNDYWKVHRLLESQADTAIAFDGDMRIVSADDARVLPGLAQRFGLCLPINPRYMVRVDTLVGVDSDGQLDETRGTGHAVNCTPIAFSTHHERARECVEEYCRIMVSNPARGPLAWWRSFWKTGFSPCLLPPQWCVCQEHIGVGNEIVLHVGHERVRTHYRH